MSLTTVACCQVTLQVGDIEGNRTRVASAIEDAAASGAQVVIVPELANSGYVFADATEAQMLAEHLDGPTVTSWINLAEKHQLVLAGGLCEAGLEGELYNSAVIVDPAGIRASYRKVHLWDREKLIFTPGDSAPPVVDTMVGRLSLIICHDAEFPEWVRLAALSGTELLCVPTNWPLFPRPKGERPIEVVQIQASAFVNRMFIAACDRSGAERGVEWVEGSVITDCDGWPLAGPACETHSLVTATFDLSEAKQKRISDHNDVHADRRPDLYGALVDGSPVNRSSTSKT
jgi:predicted amidohydrolase